MYDNINGQKHANNISENSKNQRFDVINHMAVRNRISDATMEDAKPQGSILDKPLTSWLLNQQEYDWHIKTAAKHELKKILQSHMECFKNTKQERIEHQYMEEMERKSEWVRSHNWRMCLYNS